MFEMCFIDIIKMDRVSTSSFFVDDDVDDHVKWFFVCCQKLQVSKHSLVSSIVDPIWFTRRDDKKNNSNKN